MSEEDTTFDQGWLIEKFSVEAVGHLKKLSVGFLNAEQRISPECERLQDMHLHLSEDNYVDLHYRFTVFLHKTLLFYSIFKVDLYSLKKFFGLDLDIQSYPTLRISRPYIKYDNIEIQRDIEYGVSIYGHSLWTPIYDVKIVAA